MRISNHVANYHPNVTAGRLAAFDGGKCIEVIGKHGDMVERSCAGDGEGRAVMPCSLIQLDEAPKRLLTGKPSISEAAVNPEVAVT
jgi:hypothetical protein